MASYSVYYAGISLTTHQKFTIAQAITKIHGNVTGANAYFAQVIFKPLDQHNCFIGGVLLDEPHIFLSGKIRHGRSAQIKKQLLIELEIAIQKASKLAGHHIWTDIHDLPPDQMIEYGQILPNIGCEQAWFTTLPVAVQEKLPLLAL